MIYSELNIRLTNHWSDNKIFKYEQGQENRKTGEAVSQAPRRESTTEVRRAQSEKGQFQWE